MIRHVSIDLGGVVFKPGTLDEFISWIHPRCRQCSKDDIKQAFDIGWKPWNEGEISIDRFWEGFNGHLGTDFHPAHLSALLFYKDSPDPEMVDLIYMLRRYQTVGALTDVPKEWHEFHHTHYGMDVWFDFITASYRVGATKPSEIMYENVLIKAQAHPDEIVHTDDMPFGVKGAVDAGMHGILYENTSQLKQDLRELGVRF
jgi:HAD superfamily hydrolase (TIGR01509 family)